MSNRFQERAGNSVAANGAAGGVNIVAWGGQAVAAAVILADAMTNAVFVPLVGSRLEGFNPSENAGAGGWDRVRMGQSAVTAAVATSTTGMMDVKVGGNEFGRAVHLASQTLPGAGAFTSQATFSVPSGVGEITFWVTYTIGAAGGFPLFRLLFGNGTEEGNDVVLNTAIAVAQPFGTQQIFEQTIEGPHPSSGAAINFVIATRVPRGATTARIVAAEGGVPATPGTIAIALAGGTLR